MLLSRLRYASMMASTRFTTHDAYIAAQPAQMRKPLATIRATVGKAAPNAVEVISYGMPAYKLNGRILLYFAAWKAHVAIYPGSATTLAALADLVQPYVASKGTLRFEAGKPVPVRVVRTLARMRATEVAAATCAVRPSRTRTGPDAAGPRARRVARKKP